MLWSSEHDANMCSFIGFQATALTLPSPWPVNTSRRTPVPRCHTYTFPSYQKNLDISKKTTRDRWQNNVFVLTFAPANDEIITNPTKTTPNDVTTLLLTRIFTCYFACMDIPKVNFLKNQSIIKRGSKKKSNWPLTFGEWFISAYWESWVICILVSSPSKRVDLAQDNQQNNMHDQNIFSGDEERKSTHDSVCLVAKSKTINLACAASVPVGGSLSDPSASTSLDWVASVVGGVSDRNSVPSATKYLKLGVNANSVIRMAVGPHTSRTFPSTS